MVYACSRDYYLRTANAKLLGDHYDNILAILAQPGPFDLDIC